MFFFFIASFFLSCEKSTKVTDEEIREAEKRGFQEEEKKIRKEINSFSTLEEKYNFIRAKTGITIDFLPNLEELQHSFTVPKKENILKNFSEAFSEFLDSAKKDLPNLCKEGDSFLKKLKERELNKKYSDDYSKRLFEEIQKLKFKVESPIQKLFNSSLQKTLEKRKIESKEDNENIISTYKMKNKISSSKEGIEYLVDFFKDLVSIEKEMASFSKEAANLRKKIWPIIGLLRKSKVKTSFFDRSNRNFSLNAANLENSYTPWSIGDYNLIGVFEKFDDFLLKIERGESDFIGSELSSSLFDFLDKLILYNDKIRENISFFYLVLYCFVRNEAFLNSDLEQVIKNLTASKPIYAESGFWQKNNIARGRFFSELRKSRQGNVLQEDLVLCDGVNRKYGDACYDLCKFPSNFSCESSILPFSIKLIYTCFNRWCLNSDFSSSSIIN